jgi:hypothetical protein
MKIALMMEATSTFETSVNFYRKTQRNNPGESRLQKILNLSGANIPRV